jgi:hypothetical protein
VKKLVILGLVLVTLMACERGASGDAGVRGVVFLGPMCPVVSPNGPCPDEPMPNTKVEVLQGGDVVTVLTTDAQGRFEAALEPGSYELQVVLESPGPLFARPVPVTVPSSGYAQVDVTVDTGIR